MIFHTGLLIVRAVVLAALAGMTLWYARACRRGRSEQDRVPVGQAEPAERGQS